MKLRGEDGAPGNERSPGTPGALRNDNQRRMQGEQNEDGMKIKFVISRTIVAFQTSLN
jgi:hypothetical protein